MAEAKDKSDPAIIFRAPPEFRQALEVIAVRENKTVSMLLREVLASAVALGECAEKTPLFLDWFITKMCSEGLIRAMINDSEYPVDPSQLSGADPMPIPKIYCDFCDGKRYESALKLGYGDEIENKVRLTPHFVGDDGMDFVGHWIETPDAFRGPEAVKIDRIAKIRNIDELKDQTEKEKTES